MYRSYEDPRTLEREVNIIKDKFVRCEDPTERLFLDEELYEMKQRAREAWADEEFDEGER